MKAYSSLYLFDQKYRKNSKYCELLSYNFGFNILQNIIYFSDAKLNFQFHLHFHYSSLILFIIVLETVFFITCETFFRIL